MDSPQPSFSNSDIDIDEFAAHGPTNVLLSIVIAGALVAAGVMLVIRRDLPWLPVESFRNSDKHALGTGILMIGAGLFLHFRVFWQRRRPDMWYTTLGMIIGLLTLIGGAVVIALRFFRMI